MIKFIFISIFLISIIISYKASMINKCKFEKIVSSDKKELFFMTENGNIIDSKLKIGQLVKVCGKL